MNPIKPLIASAALVLAFTTGCGGDDGGRPSVEEISDAIQGGFGTDLGGEVTDDVATCLAEAFHDSDLSDGALRALVEEDDDYKASDDDAAALQKVSAEAGPDCVADSTE